MIKIGFESMWEPFDPQTNFYTELLRSRRKEIQIVPPEECEILFYSCYTQNFRKYKPKMKIYVTGENTRPNFDECDYAMTFDEQKGRNIHCPLWLMQLDWFEKGGYTNPKYLIPLSHLQIQPFNLNPYPLEKEFFCSIVVNNFFPVRKAMYDLLSTYKKINSYGRPWNNWTYGEDIKLDIIHRGKFNICFENAKYNGYFTEKPIHARIARTIPLYYADEHFSNVFNRKGFVMFEDFSNEIDFMNHIKKIDESKDLFEEYLNQPIFTAPKYHIEVFQNIISKIDQII